MPEEAYRGTVSASRDWDAETRAGFYISTEFCNNTSQLRTSGKYLAISTDFSLRYMKYRWRRTIHDGGGIRCFYAAVNWGILDSRQNRPNFEEMEVRKKL
jgi:hypothetical protein